MSIINLYKPAGWTPLAAMESLRAATPTLVGAPMVYAGRLDPMAEGVLLVLTGEDRHTLAEHLRHDKTYVATFLLGLRSDTHDALGIVEKGRARRQLRCRRARPGSRMRARSSLRSDPPPSPGSPPSTRVAPAALRIPRARVRALCRAGWRRVASPAPLAEITNLAGTHTLPLPAWSAYKVRGRPLHAWAAEGRLAEVEIPRRDMVVHAVRDAAVGEIAPEALLAEVTERVAVVRGSFRQEAVLASWSAALTDRTQALVTVTATLDVASGVYVRALAEHLGARLGCGALLLRLVRTRVGAWGVEASTRLSLATGARNGR